MKVLGIDPSLRNFGFARADLDVGTLEFKVEKLRLVSTDPIKKAARKVVRKNSDDLSRGRTLYLALVEELAGVDMVFVEAPVGSQSARAMASYGICIGLLSSIGIPMFTVTPDEVKIAAVGDKGATKREMIIWAEIHHKKADWLKVGNRLIDKNEHLADAIAAIKAGTQLNDFRSLVTIMSSMKEAA